MSFRGGTNFTDFTTKPKTVQRCPPSRPTAMTSQLRGKLEGGWSKFGIGIQAIFSQMPPWDLGIFESYMKTHKIEVNMYGKYTSPIKSAWVFESLKNF